MVSPHGPPLRPAQETALGQGFFEVFAYSRRALELVWQTSPRLTIVLALLTVGAGVIPAATARRFSATPEQMAVGASLVGVLSVALGLAGSFQWDVPSGPMMVVVASACFALSLLWPRRHA